MGNLINPISLQIKYHGSWKITWSQYLRKDFAYFFFLDRYIKSLVDSIIFLKSYFNKFFFYELKFFMKNDFILFYFSFRLIRKTLFKRYWTHFKRKMKYNISLQKRSFVIRKKNFLIKDILKSRGPLLFSKISFLKMFKTFNYRYILYTLTKYKERLFPYDFALRLKIISLKIKNFNLFFKKHKLFNIYILNNLCFLKNKLKFLIFKEIIFNLKAKSYGKSLSLYLVNVYKIYR